MAPRDARALRSVYRRILAGVLAAAPLVACGGEVGGGGGGAGGGGDGDDDAPVCATSSPPAQKGPCGWSVGVTSFSACGFTVPSTGYQGMLLGSETQCKAICGFEETYCFAYKSDEREPTAIQCGHACAGRRYDGLDDASAPVALDAGSYLARMAFYEASSIDAFAILARDLARHGAPRALVRSCQRARADEVKHAKMARTMARRHGHGAERPPASPPTERARSLEALAVENAVEGCVREAFGVVIGMWQAAHAPTKELRGFFTTLVLDEARHAALALRIDEWLRSQLGADAHARVAAARAHALRELVDEAEAMAPAAGLGLPDARSAAALARAFAAAA